MYKKGKWMLFLLLLLGSLLVGTNVQIQAATGDRSYIVSKKKVWKVNRENGKVTAQNIKSSKIVDQHMAFGQIHGDYIYFISDILPKEVDEWYRWGYLCRVKKDGTGFKVLGKAQNFCIANEQIFYNRVDFTVKKNYESSNRITYMGIYAIKLNGTKRHQVLGKENYLVGAKGNALYTAQTTKIKGAYGYHYSKEQLEKIDFSEIRFTNYDADGEKLKSYTCSWKEKNEVFYQDGKLYVHPAKQSSYKVLNLDTGKVSKVAGKWENCDKEKAFFQSTKGKAILKTIETGKQSNVQDTSNSTNKNQGTNSSAAKKVSYPVKIDKKHFPDDTFRKRVQKFDQNKDGKLSKKEAESEIDVIYVGKNATYQGLEYFPRIYILGSGGKATISDSYSGEVKIDGEVEGKKLLIKGGKNITALTITNVEEKQIEIESTMSKLKEFTVYCSWISGMDFKKIPNVERIVTSSAGWIQNDGQNLRIQGLKQLKEVIVYPQGDGASLMIYDCPKVKSITAKMGINKVEANNCAFLTEIYVDSETQVDVKNCKNCKIVKE